MSRGLKSGNAHKDEKRTELRRGFVLFWLPSPPRSAVFSLSCRRGGTLACPSSADHDVRRARRLGAPRLTEVSPCGASFFPSDGKETKGSPWETHIAVGNRFPPAPVRSPPDPGNLRGPIPGGDRSLSGAGGATTAPVTAPLPLSVRNQDGLVCWTKRARLMAQGLISAEVNWRAGRRPAPTRRFRLWAMRWPTQLMKAILFRRDL